MKYAIAAGFVFDNFDSQHIEGYSVVRVYKVAPALFQLINHIDKSFQVAMRPCNGKASHLIHISTSYSHSASFPATVTEVYYYMTSWEVWRVDPDSKTPTSQVGYNLGLCNLKDRSVSYNIEFKFDLEILLHEIVHQKQGRWGEELVKKASAMVLQDCPHFLKNIEGLNSKLNLEFNRIVRDFARFDYKVGQILGIKEANALRSPRPNDRG